MASKKSPSIFGTLQKTADNAAAVNGEFVRQLRVDALEENPMNRFSMAEDAQFQATMDSVEKDGFLEDIIVTPAEAEGPAGGAAGPDGHEPAPPERLPL